MAELIHSDSEEKPPFRWQGFDIFLFVAFAAATVLLLPILLRLLRPGLRTGDLSGLEQISIQALLDLALVGFIFLTIRVLHKQSILQTLRWVPQNRFPTGRLIANGAFLALTVLLLSMLFPTPSESPLEKLLARPVDVAAFVLFGIAGAPLLEEIMFRGFLYTALTDVWGSRVGVPVTAVLFAGLHVSQLRGNWPAVLLILTVGYILTVIRKRSDSLVPSVLMHTAYNSMIFGIAALPTLVTHGPLRN